MHIAIDWLPMSSLLLDRVVLESNRAAMAARARRHGMRRRPHLTTVADRWTKATG